MTALAERLLVGAIAQLVERVLCKHEVVGSIPSGSTMEASRRYRGDTSFHHLASPVVAKKTS